MKIALLRHARVKHHEPLLSTEASFRQDRADFDDSPLIPPVTVVNPEEFPQCFVSPMDRALGTAEIVYPGPARQWPALKEVDSGLHFLASVPFPTVLRRWLSRIAWFFNSSKTLETRRESMKRAHQVVHQLVHGRINTLLVTHGFFMLCLQHELRKFGFKGTIGLTPDHGVLHVFESNAL